LLGESPIYRQRDQTLHYIDVLISTIHIIHISVPDKRRSITCPEPVASVNLCEGNDDAGGYLVCTYTGIARLSEDGEWTALKELVTDKERGKVRLNDSAVDGKGRLWVGSLDIWLDGSDVKRPYIPDGYEPLGSLYRYDPDGSLHTIIDGGIVCSNGIGWTGDYCTMFHTDSFRQTIWAFDYKLESGDICNRRVQVDRSGQEGEPDGLVVDTEGCLFTFIWEGSMVEKYDPTGGLVRRWRLDAHNVTHGAWAGERMDQLFVTTAKGKRTDQGGGLF
ncbi:hypothetical protein BO94DRAFT_427383, partial [Aspergillus sclerotioniger CBS 115572]